jgi:hypothetical protein
MTWQHLNVLKNKNIQFFSLVLDHFTEKSFYRFFLTERHLTETPFLNTVWPNTIWPKCHLTETPFDRTPFDRSPFDRKAIWPKHHLTERRSFYGNKSFGRKQNLSKGRLTENIWKRVFDRKSNLKTSQMTENSFDRKVIWPKVHLTESFFEKNSHLTERSFDRIFFLNGRLTENIVFRKNDIWPTVHISLE